MTNHKKFLATKQLNIRQKFIEAGNEDIKHAKNEFGEKLSRHEIADKMTELLGEKITASMLYNWTAKSHKRHRFPFIYLPAFVSATGQRRVLKLFLSSSLPHAESLGIKIKKINKKIEKLITQRQGIELFIKELKRGAKEDF